QAGLSRRRVADQSDIRDGLELEYDIALVARRSEQGEAGGLALGARQRRVAEATLATFRDDEALAGDDHVDEDVTIGVLHDGADGREELEWLACIPRAVVTHTESAVAGGAMRRVVVREE